MQKNGIDIYKLQTRCFDLEKTTVKINIADVYSRSERDINEIKLFIAHFKEIPNFIHEIKIDCIKANRWFLKNYETEIKDLYFNKRYFNRNKNAEFEDIYYFLYEDLIVNFDHNQCIVRFLFRKTSLEVVEQIAKGIKKHKKRSRVKPVISLLIETKNGIGTTVLDIIKPKLKIEDNYNEDFLEVHNTIVKRLSKQNDKGIVLLHGKPGTGKTSYIRYLISTVKKNIIFLPPNMANAITSPYLVSILIDNPNSIFVIEDAENIVIDRERNGSSPVSALLNISDGLLSDCLNIQIICSFNTDVSKIDSALLRKGRLIAKYDFIELELDKANRLSEKLGHNTKFIAPMPLTAIYNQDEQDLKLNKTSSPIGFKSRNVG